MPFKATVADLPPLTEAQKTLLLKALWKCNLRRATDDEAGVECDDSADVAQVSACRSQHASYFPQNCDDSERVPDTSNFNHVRLFQLQCMHALIQRRHLLCIAGTGQGKSAVSAIFWYYCSLEREQEKDMINISLANPCTTEIQKKELLQALQLIKPPVVWSVEPTNALASDQARGFELLGLQTANYIPEGEDAEEVEVLGILPSCSDIYNKPLLLFL